MASTIEPPSVLRLEPRQLLHGKFRFRVAAERTDWTKSRAAAPSSLPREFIQQTGGGRTAIGRVTANGQDVRTLKLYAVTGTSVDDWFARTKEGKEQFDDPRLVHGFLTYDYFAIVRALGETDGKLGQPKVWTAVPFPMALVILGPTTHVPWAQ